MIYITFTWSIVPMLTKTTWMLKLIHILCLYVYNFILEKKKLQEVLFLPSHLTLRGLRWPSVVFINPKYSIMYWKTTSTAVICLFLFLFMHWRKFHFEKIHWLNCLWLWNISLHAHFPRAPVCFLSPELYPAFKSYLIKKLILLQTLFHSLMPMLLCSRILSYTGMEIYIYDFICVFHWDLLTKAMSSSLTSSFPRVYFFTEMWRLWLIINVTWWIYIMRSSPSPPCF